MLISNAQPLMEINHEAITILCREMGVAKTLRFLNQFTLGTGNYTAERQLIPDPPIAEIMADIAAQRAHYTAEQKAKLH